MENKINIAELLKDCPKGMELDCTMFNDVVFERIDVGAQVFPIVLRRQKTNTYIYTTKYGHFYDNDDSKCVIFPKGKTTWEGFVPPCKFKDGDIVATSMGDCVFILKEVISYRSNNICEGKCYFGAGLRTELFFDEKANWFFSRLATEEEKQKLFDAVKANGYKWNAETMTLEKLVEPKFKVGDRIQEKDSNVDVVLITDIIDDYYIVETKYGMKLTISMDSQNIFKLVLNKFDINTLIPLESKVLVREAKTDVWQPTFYGFFHQRNRRFYTTSSTWLMCIPYNEDTKHLIGTTDDCDEFYKTWE